jgi:ankyrin repeat protein
MFPKRLLLVSACGAMMAGCGPTATEIDRMDAKVIFSDRRVAELVLAAETGNTDRIKQLADEGIDVNFRGRYNVTPLLRSILAKNKEGYTSLLKLGADPNLLDQNGFSALHLSAREKDSSWLREALAHGGKPNLENTGNQFYPGKTPLFGALEERQTENVRLLIDAGADVNHRSKKSGQPLDVAMSRSFELVYVLLERGVQYEAGDFADSMNLSLRNNLSGVEEKDKVWFHKTIEWLEKKGSRFDRPK